MERSSTPSIQRNCCARLTTKILSVGTALELLGSDFRFHTRVYRAGSVHGNEVDGDLILVASGDPDLSNRIQPDGTMLFENEDHSYDGFAEAKPVPGDPLAVLRELASKIAAKESGARMGESLWMCRYSLRVLAS